MAAIAFTPWGTSPYTAQSLGTPFTSQFAQPTFVQPLQIVLQQLQQVVQIVAQQLQQLQHVVQFIPHQIQQLQQQFQTQQVPFGIAGMPGTGLSPSALGVSGWAGSPTFYPQPGQVM